MKKLLILFLSAMTGWLAGFATGHDMTLMTYNVRNCIGMDEKTDIGRVAEVIKRISPDVVALQEIDSVTRRSRGIDLIDTLARLTGMYGYFSAAIDYDGGKYGIGMLCRHRPERINRFALPGREELRTMILAEFPGYVFAGTHLSLTEADRMASVSVIDSISSQYTCSRPFIVAGDFNSRPDEDACSLFGNKCVFLNNTDEHTYPASDPVETIDYIMLYRESGCLVEYVSSEVIDEPLASDHRPLVVKIRIK